MAETEGTGKRPAAKGVIRYLRISILLLLMISSSLHVSHMFVTRVLSSLVSRVVLL